MNKDKKKIRSKLVRESLEEMELLESTMDKISQQAVSDLVNESVKKNLNRFLSEASEDPNAYEEEETDEFPSSADDADAADNGDTAGQESLPSDNDDLEQVATGDDASLEDDVPAATADDLSTDDLGSDDEWAEFDAYKTEDGSYDMTGADMDTSIKVFKLMNQDSDDVVIKNTDNGIQLKDNNSGEEYLIKTGDTEDAAAVPAVDDDTEDVEPSLDDDSTEDIDVDVDDNATDKEDDDDDNETVYEMVLRSTKKNKVNENLGYTTDYQKKTAMTTPSNNEPADASATYSMDDGVPTGTEKPYGKDKGDAQPFDKNVNEGCEECNEGCCDTEDKEVNEGCEECNEDQVEEATNVGGFVQQNSTVKSHVPNSNGRAARNQSKGAVPTSTSTPRYSAAQMESVKQQVKAIYSENKEIKQMLSTLKVKLYEAAVTNRNLGLIIKLVTENATTKDEKQNIIKRFGEVKNFAESDKLYESISKELKEVARTSNIDKTMNGTIVENVEGAKKQETTIYESDEVRNIKDLMKRVSDLYK